MKKIYILMIAGIFTTSLFAQKTPIGLSNSSDLKFQSTKEITPVVNSPKDINATLNETFESPSFPPASWTLAGTAWYISTASAVAGIESIATGGTGHFATFDSYNEQIGVAASMVTPVLHPTAGSNTLSYSVNAAKVSSNPGYQGTGPGLFIEFSTNGTTWTTSTTNVLAALPNYNTASTGWQTLTASLAAYDGATVQVRFRAVSDYGWLMVCLDNVTGPQADIVTSVNDVQLLGTYADFSGMSYYEITPLTQAGDVNLTGAVINNGSAAQTNVTLHADDAVNGITGTTIIPSQPSAQIDTMVYVATLDNANAKDYGFKMNVTQTQTDEVPANNLGDSIFFSTDPSMYYRTINLTQLLTSYSFGTGAPAITGMEYGANYHFLVDDKVDTVIALIYGSIGTGSVTAKLYNQDLSTGVRTLVGSSAPFTPSGIPEFAMLPLTTFYTVVAPAVLTATIQMNLNVTTAPRDTIEIGADNAFPGDAGLGGAAYLNVSGTWGWYYITGTVPIVGLIIDRTTGINPNYLSKDVYVYPNPVSNTLYVMNKKATSVEIYNLSGQLVASYNNQNVIDVTNLAKGEYLVKIVTDAKVITEKISIVH